MLPAYANGIHVKRKREKSCCDVFLSDRPSNAIGGTLRLTRAIAEDRGHFVSGGKNQFTAAAAAAGYLYQARLALLLCLPHVNGEANIEVAIELLDDISFASAGSPRELLQTKHHINRAAALSDGSPDLWKTLRVWSSVVSGEPSLPNRTRLVLITTATAPVDSAAAMLRPAASSRTIASRSPKDAAERLTKFAQTSTNNELKAAFEAFLALTPPLRASLLSAIEILDAQPTLVDLDAAIENELRLVAPRGKANQARELLEGWWWPRICHALVTTPVQAIPVAAIEAKLDDIRDQLKRNALVADFQNADPSEGEIAEYDAFRFVRQLKAIGIGGNRVRYAKRDYYRAFAQRSKWTREHVVVDEELEKFEATLVEEWEPRFDVMCDTHKDAADEALLQHAAQEIYQWVETEARFPFRSLNARFLNVGSYHILANDLRVGWHMNYRELCADEEE